MVFSSIPAYNPDPSNWQQQQNQQTVLGSTSTSPFLPPQPSAPPPGSIRPGSMAERARMANIPVPESSLKCPRCESINTKFCYFNNYSLSQPRHFCKTCRRYWTRGGALRSVPVGGGYRRNRRSKPASKSTAGSADRTTQTTSSNSTDSPAGIMPPPLRFASPMNQPAGNFSPQDDMVLSYTSDMNFQLGSIFGGVGAPLASSGGGIVPWQLQQVQNFPFLGALDTSPPLPPEIYNFQGSDAGQLVRPRSLSSSILTQRGSVKNEESSEPRIKDNQWNESTSSSWTELSSFRISTSN